MSKKRKRVNVLQKLEEMIDMAMRGEVSSERSRAVVGAANAHTKRLEIAAREVERTNGESEALKHLLEE